MCSPPCRAGYLCSPTGTCVRSAADNAFPSVRAVESAIDACLPSCRSGFTCVGGQCVSACNPLCTAGERCTSEGECIDPREGRRGCAAAVPTATAVSDPASSIVNIHLDVLGALQVGLTPTLEVGKTVSGYLRLRAVRTGLLSHLILTGGDEQLHRGVGAALGLHFFSGRDGNMRGLFWGPALEYAFVATRDASSGSAAYEYHLLVPQLDLGHRWVRERFLLGFGARAGLSIPVSASCHHWTCSDPDTSFVASIFLDLGWFFGS